MELTGECVGLRDYYGSTPYKIVNVRCSGADRPLPGYTNLEWIGPEPLVLVSLVQFSGLDPQPLEDALAYNPDSIGVLVSIGPR